MTQTASAGQARPAGFTVRWIIAAAIIAAVHGATLTSHWRMGSDSARYLSLSRSLVEGRGYTISGDVQWSVPPLVPLYYAGVFKALGFQPGIDNLTGHFTAVNAFVLLWALVAIAAAFLFAREVSGTRQALVVALLVAVNDSFHNTAADPLSDVPYAALVWGALFLFARAERLGRRADFAVAGALTAAAVLTRMAGPALAGAALLYFGARAMGEGAKRRGMMAGAASALPGVAVATAMLAAIKWNSGSVGFNYYDMFVTGRDRLRLALEALGHVAGAPRYFFEMSLGLESTAGLWVVFAAIVALGGWSLWKRGVRLPAILLVFHVLLVATVLPLLPRLSLPLLPIIYLYGIEGLARTRSAAERFLAARNRRLRLPEGAAARAIAVAVIAVNLSIIGGDIAKEFSPDFYALHDHGKWADYVPLGRRLAAEPPAGKVLSRWWTVTTMLSGADTVMTPPFVERAADPQDYLRAYVDANSVGAVVADARDDPMDVLQSFLENGPYRWRESGRFGRLTLYVRDDLSAAGAP